VQDDGRDWRRIGGGSDLRRRGRATSALSWSNRANSHLNDGGFNLSLVRVLRVTFPMAFLSCGIAGLGLWIGWIQGLWLLHEGLDGREQLFWRFTSAYKAIGPDG
jgi:hypothetical protein